MQSALVRVSDGVVSNTRPMKGMDVRNIVNAVLLAEEGVLLARRSPERKAYPGLWSFPGGHVETGETLEEALVRELHEEIGIVPLAYNLVGQIADPNSLDDPIIYHFYEAHRWTGQPTIIDHEHTHLKWFSCDDALALPDLALEEYRQLLVGIRDRRLAPSNARPSS